MSSFLRIRPLAGNCFDALFRSSGRPGGPEKEEEESGTYEDKDNDGWVAALVSAARFAACTTVLTATSFVWAFIMVVLLPWPYARLRQGNVYAHLTGTVGVVKREIIQYPFFGQLFLLSNHLRIDRSNHTAALESINKVARSLVSNNLSLIICPEGTRSPTGRLRPFKKGFVHIALQSRLPIVPIVVTGTHLSWRKNSMRLRPAPLTVRFLPPIKTDDWERGKVDEHIEMVRSLYINHLPQSQQPELPA